MSANGELVAKTITIPEQTPLAGDIINVNGRTVAVKNAIPAGYAGPIGIDANRQLVGLSSSTDQPSFHTGNVTSGGYTEVLPYWGYSNFNEYTTYPSDEGASVTIGNLTITRKKSDGVYWYDVAIPTWTDGSIRLLTVDFCCAGDNESLADMRVWLINGRAAVNIAKVHSFSFGYKVDGEQINNNKYSSYQGVLPIKSGINLRFVSATKIRHMHVLLFNG